MLDVEIHLRRLDIGPKLLWEPVHRRFQLVGMAWITVRPPFCRSSATTTSSISRPSASVPTYTAASSSCLTSVALDNTRRIRPALNECFRADLLIRTRMGSPQVFDRRGDNARHKHPSPCIIWRPRRIVRPPAAQVHNNGPTGTCGLFACRSAHEATVELRTVSRRVALVWGRQCR